MRKTGFDYGTSANIWYRRIYEQDACQQLKQKADSDCVFFKAETQPCLMSCYLYGVDCGLRRENIPGSVCTQNEASKIVFVSEQNNPESEENEPSKVMHHV
jgi:hypothetical protein